MEGWAGTECTRACCQGTSRCPFALSPHNKSTHCIQSDSNGTCSSWALHVLLWTGGSDADLQPAGHGVGPAGHPATGLQPHNCGGPWGAAPPWGCSHPAWLWLVGAAAGVGVQRRQLVGGSGIAWPRLCLQMLLTRETKGSERAETCSRRLRAELWLLGAVFVSGVHSSRPPCPDPLRCRCPGAGAERSADLKPPCDWHRGASSPRQTSCGFHQPLGQKIKSTRRKTC